MAKPARRRPVLRGALWLTAGVCTGIAIGIADARLRARRTAFSAPPRRLPAPLPPIEPAPSRPVRRRRARRLALGVAVLLVLAALGAGIAFVATGDTRQAVPTPTTAAVAGTATVRRTPTRARTTTAADTRTTRSAKGAGAGATTTGFVPARVFAWPQVAGADRYEIRFYRGARLLLRRQIRQSRFALPGALKLSPGRYRWVVRPHVRGTFRRAIVDSRFSVG